MFRSLVLLLWICSSIFTDVNAQRLSRGFGFQYGSTQSIPVFRYNKPSNQIIFEDSMLRASAALPVISLNFPVVFRIAEFEADHSLAMVAVPTLGMYFNGPEAIGPYGADDFMLYGIPLAIGGPLTLQYMFGNFATTASDKGHGLGIGAGIDYLFMADRWWRLAQDTNDPFYGYASGKAEWFRPTIALHYRFWTQTNVLTEVAFSSAFGNETFMGEKQSRPMHRLSLNIYPKY